MIEAGLGRSELGLRGGVGFFFGFEAGIELVDLILLGVQLVLEGKESGVHVDPDFAHDFILDGERSFILLQLRFEFARDGLQLRGELLLQCLESSRLRIRFRGQASFPSVLYGLQGSCGLALPLHELLASEDVSRFELADQGYHLVVATLEEVLELGELCRLGGGRSGAEEKDQRREKKTGERNPHAWHEVVVDEVDDGGEHHPENREGRVDGGEESILLGDRLDGLHACVEPWLVRRCWLLDEGLEHAKRRLDLDLPPKSSPRKQNHRS